MIREAKLNDLDAIYLIEHMSFLSERFTKRQLRYLIDRSRCKTLVYARSQDVIGYAITSLHSKHHHGRLYSIAVKPSERSDRVGSQLLTASEKIVSQYKQGIRLEVRPSNIHAIRFYKKHEYQQIGIKLKYYNDGESAYIYAKDFRCLPND